MRIRALALATSLLALAVSAQATPHLTPINPAPGGELNVGTILDTLYGVGNYVRVNDGSDQWWTGTSPGGLAQAKYAGYKQNFGYVDGLGFHSLFQVTGNGLGFLLGPEFSFFTPATDPFKWADKPTNGSTTNFWTSVEADNLDQASKVDHMVTFLITGGSAAGHYVVAFEDLSGSQGSDRDFNDLVVELQGAAPVPEPGTVALLGLGLVGLGWRARRRLQGPAHR